MEYIDVLRNEYKKQHTQFKENLKFLTEQRQTYISTFAANGYSAISLRIKYKFSDTESFYERIFLDFEKVLKKQSETIDQVKESMARTRRMQMSA